MTPISTTQWFMGFVNNICPECARGSLDQVPTYNSATCPVICLHAARRGLGDVWAADIAIRWISPALILVVKGTLNLHCTPSRQM